MQVGITMYMDTKYIAEQVGANCPTGEIVRMVFRIIQCHSDDYDLIEALQSVLAQRKSDIEEEARQ